MAAEVSRRLKYSIYTVRILNLSLVLNSRTECLPFGSRLDKKFVWMSRLSCKQVGDWFVDV